MESTPCCMHGWYPVGGGRVPAPAGRLGATDAGVGEGLVAAAHLPHAVGLAWAAKIRRDPIASLSWFGDGATSEGDFHEAMNFAGVLKAPTVFFCVNNQWAISTPFHKQTATATIAEKAAAYAMPGIRVDGFDPIACWKVTRDALDRARGLVVAAAGRERNDEAYRLDRIFLRVCRTRHGCNGDERECVNQNKEWTF